MTRVKAAASAEGREKVLGDAQARVGEFKDMFKGVNGLVKENVVFGYDMLDSMLSDEQKLADVQFDYVLSVQKEFDTKVRTAVQDLPNKSIIEANLDQFARAQEGYIDFARNFQGKFVKDALDMSRKSTEKIMSTIEGIVGNIKV